MLVTSRRSLILGITSLIAAPSLVKASSLMDLRGYNMDPVILALKMKSASGGWLPSMYNLHIEGIENIMKVFSEQEWILNNIGFDYKKMRKSLVIE